MKEPPVPRSGQYLTARFGRDLIDWIRSLRPIGDRSTTRTRQTPNGTAITAMFLEGEEENNGNEYDGAFKITKKQDSDTVIQIYDASDGNEYDSEVEAGLIYNGLSYATLEKAEISISATVDIFVSLTYDSGYQAEIETGVFCIGEPGIYNHHIGTVIFEDGKISKIIQTFHGKYIEVAGRG